LIEHLRHQGVGAALHRVKKDGRIGETLISVADSYKADLVVMGGYGHSRLREWLLGGATYDMMHRSPTALLVAH
jgi:nucleotide-binding universal stress UspA family protein